MVPAGSFPHFSSCWEKWAVGDRSHAYGATVDIVSGSGASGMSIRHTLQ